MAEAVAEHVRGDKHLLVQAGTGTGKSLAYLVPALAHAVKTRKPVVVSTATLALQAQVVERDLPRLADALEPLLGRRPTWQLVKGRRNYVCPRKLEGGFPAEEDALFEVQSHSRLEQEIVRLRAWAEKTQSGDRDELVPGVSERAWRQVSVSAHECVGAQRCPQASECFCERSRERAREVDLVVSNHAFVAIDAFEGRSMLPEHDVLVVDEAHELAARVTSVVTDELTPAMVEAAARRARQAGAGDTGRLSDAGMAFGAKADELPEGRLPRGLPDDVTESLVVLREEARAVLTALKDEPGAQAPPDGSKQVARAAVSEVFDVAERLTADADPADPGGAVRDVVWVTRRADGGQQGIHVAPVSVAGLLRERLFGERCVVMTSATLTLGGSFDACAGSVGLLGEGAPRWTGLDVGSPFDYPRQGMLYIARHLPPPGRDGVGQDALAELAALITAAGGRTLGLFSSRRAAEAAAVYLREHVDVPVLCQGDDATPTLVRMFAADPRTCLVGTLSLWQGVDVPGPTCQLVVIDRIPFPRPDDPLSSARAEVVARSGGNGFMSVAATHAALLLAQGAGRLIRTAEDRGVVAVLDSRLFTARYANFLRTSLPPFWTTTDRAVVMQALARIDRH
jgi:ATP-dependent DNA helicase DinG